MSSSSENSYLTGARNLYKNHSVSDSKRYLNNHNIMLVFAIIILFIAFFWLIALSGVQTGSSATSGFGSIFDSSGSIDTNGDTNPTYEVVAEFFIALFLIIGMVMLTYVLTVKKTASKLIEHGHDMAALIINGNKDITPEVMARMQKEGLQNYVNVLGLPANTIKEGLIAIKEKGRDYASSAIDYGTGTTREDREYNRRIKEEHEEEIRLLKEKHDEDIRLLKDKRNESLRQRRKSEQLSRSDGEDDTKL